jgi:hypothetical protein
VRTVLIVAATVLLTAGTTQAVNRLVTSRDIKNGTIQPVDLSPKAKRVLKGNGRIGPPGPQGPQGLQGERGPAGFSSVLTSSSGTILGPNSGGTATASCYSGRPVGGGFYASSPNVGVYVSYPTTGGWQVRGFNYGSTFSEILSAYVLCASS